MNTRCTTYRPSLLDGNREQPPTTASSFGSNLDVHSPSKFRVMEGREGSPVRTGLRSRRAVVTLSRDWTVVGTCGQSKHPKGRFGK